MGKFVYRMQNIFEIKKKLEEAEKTAYALAVNKLRNEEEKLEILKRKKEYHLERKREGMSSVINVKELELIENAIHTSDILIKEQIICVKAAEKEVEEARVRLENAMKERKIHEKLREKAFDAFLEEEKAAEQAEINEFVSYRFGNGKKVQED